MNWLDFGVMRSQGSLCMQKYFMITSLEPMDRSKYTGIYKLLNKDGDLDYSLLYKHSFMMYRIYINIPV